RWPHDAIPRWYAHLRPANALQTCLEGPEGMVAILSRDGTIASRTRSNGHLLWRRVASHRISRTGAVDGPYLFVAPDASRTLEAYRWSDGSPAGLFILDSEDASFASAPVITGGRIFILAIQSPRLQTRVLVLEPRSVGNLPAKAPNGAVAPR